MLGTEYRTHPKFTAHLIGDDGSVLSKRTGRQIFIYHRHDGGRSDAEARIYSRSTKKYHWIRVATLVCEAFHGFAPAPRMHVNHLDGNHLNNSAINLEWATPSENIKHAFRTGLISKVCGADHPAAVFTEQQARQVLEMRCQGIGYNTIAKAVSAKRDQVRKICDGRTWQYIWLVYRDRLPHGEARPDLRKRTDADNRLIAHEASVLPLDVVCGKWHFRNHSSIQRIARQHCLDNRLDENLLTELRSNYWQYIEQWTPPVNSVKFMEKLQQQ